MSEIQKNYLAGKAWSKAEKCLRLLTHNHGTVSDQIRLGLYDISKIRPYVKRAGLEVNFDKHGVFNEVGVIAPRNSLSYSYENHEKLNKAHWDKKHKMLNELVFYCTGVIAAAAKVHAS